MAEFDIQKVFRQVDNELKKAYFQSRVPDMKIDWKSVGPKNVNPLFEAFKNLPTEQREKVSQEMNDVFDISINKASGPVIHNLVKLFELQTPADFEDWTLPNKSMWILINGSDEVKKRIFRYTEVDSISERFWLKVSLQGECSGKITYTGEQMSALRETISAFVFRHTGHGKQCIIDHVERDDMGEECFFVYYDKPHRIIPQWNENGFSWDVDHASSEMVFVFDYVRNELRIRAKAFDRAKRTLLCQTWADIMRGASLDQSSFRSKLYDIDDFIYREKSHLPLELVNVFSTFEVSFIDVDLDGSGKERLTYNHKDGDVYDRLDTLYSNQALVRGLAEVRKIKFRVRLNPRFKFNRDMVIYFSGDHTDLYSKNEAVRQTLADAFETLGVIQSPVMDVINGAADERNKVAV